MIDADQQSNAYLAVAARAISSEECQSLIHLSESVGYRPAVLDGAFNGPRGFIVRDGQNNHRSAVEDEPLANSLWRRVARYVPTSLDGKPVVGLNERLRFYRYDAGQQFSAHTDGYHVRENGEQSRLTLMLYLNSDYTGGETVFIEAEKIIAPQTGTVLLFAHQLWHEARPILSGRKYVLRTDVMYEANSARIAGLDKV